MLVKTNNTMIDYKELAKEIEESNFFKKYGMKSHWQVGATLVYPIQTWVPNGETEIQLDCFADYKGRTNAFKKFYNELDKKFDYRLKGWSYQKNDGSCPKTFIIYW